MSKFVCINDDMKNDAPEVVAMLADFFEAMYPIPSPFELKAGWVNRYLHVDDYNAAQSRSHWNYALLLAVAFLVLLLVCLGIDELCCDGRGVHRVRRRFNRGGGGGGRAAGVRKLSSKEEKRSTK